MTIGSFDIQVDSSDSFFPKEPALTSSTFQHPFSHAGTTGPFLLVCQQQWLQFEPGTPLGQITATVLIFQPRCPVRTGVSHHNGDHPPVGINQDLGLPWQAMRILGRNRRVTRGGKRARSGSSQRSRRCFHPSKTASVLRSNPLEFGCSPFTCRNFLEYDTWLQK